MPVTEIATLTLTPGSDIGDPNNGASQIMKDCGNMLLKQPGMQALRFGPVIEDSSQMQMFIDWETKQSHLDFIASDSYPGFLERIKPMLAGPPSFKHVSFEGSLPSAIAAPVTEVATFYFPSEPPSNYTKGVHDFVQLCQSQVPASEIKIHGYATGTTDEVIEKDGVKGRGGVLCIGWDSVEKHMELREREVFKANAQMMRQGCGAVQVHHVQLMDFVGS